LNTSRKKAKPPAVTHKEKFAVSNESSLHRTLKFRYAGPGGKTEVETGEYVADGIRKDGEYIEVQTGSFAPLKKKVKEFAANGRVRIIHPIAVSKKIEVYGEDGAFLYRRKSPVKGSPWDIFDALLYDPELPLTSGVTVEIVMADITEKRVKDGKGAWRRKGVSIKDRELSAWHESILLEKPADYLRFVPFKKREEFTVSLLAERAEIDKWTARKALYVLTKMKVVKRTGKKSNAWIYVRSR
jgi:hypothetical protein